ncbi:uncharacterized protein LOC121414366 [Lytechinus variegatus]|uniref:uncharacterized protein LOC121414366 n=1 Tax=Lytechinus variegatus TaxID=7654 RepID=UPI001BB21CB6|nr:uncharacterized protein LOC121414366 [Lytechinus variegatus]
MDSFNGENFVKEMDNGMLSVQSRIKVVRILVSWLIQEFTSKPPTDVKVALAKAVVSQFPKLKDLEGVGHIQQDFRILYPEVADKLFLEWPKIAPLVLKYADLHNPTWRESLTVPHLASSDLTCPAAEVETMALLALPQISPPGMKKVGKRSMRCSRAESSKAFINISPVGTNLPEYLENCQQKQPFVLALGDILKPEQVFVICDGAALEAMSLIHGADLCFKAIYIFCG